MRLRGKEKKRGREGRVEEERESEKVKNNSEL